MVFKERKIPKHLIIHDDYEYRQRPKIGVVKILVWVGLVALMTYVVSSGMIQI